MGPISKRNFVNFSTIAVENIKIQFYCFSLQRITFHNLGEGSVLQLFKEILGLLIT